MNAIALTAVVGALAGAEPGPPADAVELGCRDRITDAFTQVGDRITRYRFRVRPRHDTRFGPLGLTGARDYGRPGTWESMVAADQWLKSPALVRRGARVTLEVPGEQRGWMRLEYAHTPPARYAVTLTGCRRRGSRAAQRRECGPGPRTTCASGPTPFSGGFTIDYARAPREGRCAELIVWVDGRAAPLRKRIFAGACRSVPAA